MGIRVTHVIGKRQGALMDEKLASLYLQLSLEDRARFDHDWMAFGTAAIHRRNDGEVRYASLSEVPVAEIGKTPDPKTEG